MSAASDYLENKILDHILGGGDYTRPANLYYAVYTSGPTDSGGGTEVSGGAYARVAITNNNTNFPTASGGTKSNGAAVTFPTATGTWGTVTHIGIFDAASGGNLIFHAALSASKVITTDDTLNYPIGSIVFTLA